LVTTRRKIKDPENVQPSDWNEEKNGVWKNQKFITNPEYTKLEELLE
jgi:hypothetical protein